jgi:hypothetical protein
MDASDESPIGRATAMRTAEHLHPTPEGPVFSVTHFCGWLGTGHEVFVRLPDVCVWCGMCGARYSGGVASQVAA